ncbi:MAG: ABC transporter permease [Candidatus Thorarchaeota archaeon]
MTEPSKSSSGQLQETSTEVQSETSRILGFLIGIRNRVASRDFQKQVLWSFGSIVLALLVASVVMALSGHDPLQAFYFLMWGSITQMDLVMRYATPLILTGLSVAIAFKCGLFNIGPQGQLLMGGIAAAIVGFMFSMPIVVHPLASVIVAALAGAAWGFIPGLLKAYRGAHEVVTSMMLSYTAALLTQWLVTYPLKEQGPYAWISQTPRILDTAVLPPLLGSPYLHFGLIIAILCVVGVDILINRTVLGYELRAVGLSEKAAEYSGINPKKNMALAMGIAGGLAGVGGANEILGTYERFTDGWEGNLGWDGITVAVLGNNNPWGVLAAAIFFGALKAGGNTMQLRAGVPAEMVGVIQGLVVLFVAGPRIVDWLANRNVEFAKWMKEKPVVAVPAFALVILNILSIFYAFGGFIETGMAQSTLLLFAAMAGLAAFILTLSRRARGPIVSLMTYIVWLSVGGIGFMLALQYTLVPLVIGVLGTVLSLYGTFTARALSIETGGEP